MNSRKEPRHAPNRPARRPAPRRLAAALVSAVMLGLLATMSTPTRLPPARADEGGPVTQTQFRLPVGAEPAGAGVPAEPVTLDASVFSEHPADGATRRPAIILAHGFGGSKDDLTPRAEALARQGYVVATYTARGFGASGGRIHLNDPDFEIADAKALVSSLAARPEVLLDAPGDPRVGIAGGSYGGALALMAAGLDRRVDAIVPAITWNDLSFALAPSGVLKSRWTSVFFSGALDAALARAGEGGAPPAPAAPARRVGRNGAVSTVPPPVPVTCGRFAPDICVPFLRTAADPTRANVASLASMLRAHSPAAVLPRAGTPGSRMAPTLLIQGMADSLFGIEQAQANLADVAATGAPTAMRWFEGGHDGGSRPSDEDLRIWFDRYLKEGPPRAASITTAPATPTGASPSTGAQTTTGAPPVTSVAASTTASTAADPPLSAFSAPVPPLRRGAQARVVTHDAPPVAVSATAGTTANQTALPLAPAPGAPAAQRLLSPPGGDPSAMISLPGLPGDPTEASAAAAQATYRLAALPGQGAVFDTAPLDRTLTVVGAPRLRLSVVSSAGDATLFVSWWRVAPTGNTLPRRLVTAVRVASIPGRSRTVDVALPAATYALEAGSTWRVLVSATESGYAVPADARLYTVSLADASLVVPTPQWAQAGPESAEGRDAETAGVGIALALLVLLAALAAGLAWWRGRRDDRRDTRADLAAVPLVVEGLVKTYRDGHRAVDDVSWRADRGQVVGLLGPNGAGKTTTMRMIVGLIRPEAGRVYVHGAPVHAGSPVLGGVGALIEGPGFLPHLTGRANLRAYWQATGRPTDEARFEEALDVAALGDALDRPVRSYSHGMKQRLGIAQAMLGLPEVLLLDEPTNGLDPPQIAAMRPILRRYAEGGRTVVVSSHLLAEVEATCTHVVVMNRGRVVLTGPVEELTDSAATTIIDLAPGSSLRRAARIAMRLRKIPATEVSVDGVRLVVHSPQPRQDLVASVVAGGGDVVGVAGHRRLEEVFLGVIAQGNAASRTVTTLTDGSGSESTGPEAATGDLDSLRRVRDR